MATRFFLESRAVSVFKWYAVYSIQLVISFLAAYTHIIQPIVAVQNVLPLQQVPIGTTLIVFSQTFAGALFLSISDTIFTNSLDTLLPEYAPSVNPETVISAGATGLRSLVSATDLANVVTAYAKSVDRVFYLTAGMSAGCFIFSLAMGMKDIRKKKSVSKA